MGTEHIKHPDLPLEIRPILFDGCPRCEEHAETLYDLDRSFIERLWHRMVDVETHTWGTESYRSEAEAKACKKLFLFYILVERYGTVGPRSLFRMR